MKKSVVLILLLILINTNSLAQNNTLSVEEGGSGVNSNVNLYCKSVEEGGSGEKSVEEGGSGEKSDNSETTCLIIKIL